MNAPTDRAATVDVAPLADALRRDAERTRRQRRLDRAAELLGWFRCPLPLPHDLSRCPR